LGFAGKLLIHPSQVGPVNEVFSPSKTDVDRARRVVAAFEEAREQGSGAISLDGRMIDEANYRQAADLITAAEEIAARESPGPDASASDVGPAPGAGEA
jgi:citrate lyase beta subunit